MKLNNSNLYSADIKLYELDIIKKYIIIYLKEIFSNRLLVGTLFIDLIIIALNLVSSNTLLLDLKIFLSTSTFNIVFTYFNIGVVAMVISKLLKLEKQLNLSSLYKVLLINPRVFILSKSVSILLFIVLPYMVVGMLYFYTKH